MGEKRGWKSNLSNDDAVCEICEKGGYINLEK